MTVGLSEVAANWTPMSLVPGVSFEPMKASVGKRISDFHSTAIGRREGFELAVTLTPEAPVQTLEG